MRTFFLSTVVLFNCLLPLAVQAAESQDKSCKAFVQGFYDWYLKKCQSGKDETLAVINNKSFPFSKQLRAELKDDHDFAGHFPGEIVGLDFDPYLNAQDIATKYIVGKVSNSGAKYHADVHSVFDGKKSSKPVLVPELILENGHWTFVNFLYPDNHENKDLLVLLKQIKKNRPPLPKSKSAPSK